MQTVTSKDGTTIAFDRFGSGPAVILVGGAVQHRAIDPRTDQIAKMMSSSFTVIHYDRRGRGDSTNTQPFSIAREVEDIDALIQEVGGTASLSGMSSGAALAMEAAIALPGKVEKLAMYEPPYNDDAAARQGWREYRRNLTSALSEGRRDRAAEFFMR